jgi:hypothetical protein
VALGACGAAALVVAGAVGGLTLGGAWARQRQAEERQRWRVAEEEAEQARVRADPLGAGDRLLRGHEGGAGAEGLNRPPHWRVEGEQARHRDALAPVAGGLGLAALAPNGRLLQM